MTEGPRDFCAMLRKFMIDCCTLKNSLIPFDILQKLKRSLSQTLKSTFEVTY